MNKCHIPIQTVLLLMVLTLCVITCIAVDKPLLINLHGITKEITNLDGCSLDKWKNSQAYACECCLLQKQAELGPKASADEIIKACKDTGLCTDASLAELKKETTITKGASGIIKGASEELLMTLYDNAVVIRNMTINPTLLGTDNKFTETSLPNFLEQAYREEKLNNSDFSNAACLKVKNIAAQGGAHTAQLFLVTSTCKPSSASFYIVKGTDSLSEAIDLKNLEMIPEMKDIIAPNVIPGLPTISLPIAYFSYPDKSGTGYISTMPAAKGKELAKIIFEFRDNQSEQNKERINRAFRILGKESANFHKRFMEPIKGKIIGKTMVHGDFHPFNIFYDEIGGHFTFIDNPSMTKTMHNKETPYADFIRLILTPIHNKKLFRDLTTGVDLNAWYNTAFKNLILGYSEAYEPRERKRVLEELKTMLNSDDHPFLKAKHRVKQLPEIREKYINPVLDTLIAAQQ